MRCKQQGDSKSAFMNGMCLALLLSKQCQYYMACTVLQRGDCSLSNRMSFPQASALCRGYLAKGALFKENGRKADAQRMFIQARFYAPSEARAVVEQIANR